MVRKSYKHSILFGDGTLDSNGQFVGYDTWEDWHLIPSSRPTISMPGIEAKYVTIPGRDGAVDVSEMVRTGRPAYGDRTGSFEFFVENDKEFWMTIYPKLLNTLHGKKFKMVLREDDPDYYWDGRFTVGKYEPGDGSHSTVSIGYQVRPFKRRIRKILGTTLWDNFNFEQDYDYDPWGLNNITVNAGWSKVIHGDGYPFPLEVTVLSGPLTIMFGGEMVTMETGQSMNVGHASYGDNPVSIIGNGSCRINWQGGSL